MIWATVRELTGTTYAAPFASTTVLWTHAFANAQRRASGRFSCCRNPTLYARTKHVLTITPPAKFSRAPLADSQPRAGQAVPSGRIALE